MNEQNDYYATIEKQDFFEIIQNKYGEIAIFIDAREGKPENPILLFDGKKTGLLKRNRGLSIKFDNINSEAKEPIAGSEVVMIVELQGSMVERVYGVAVENVEEIKVSGVQTRGDEIRESIKAEDIISKFGVVKRWSSGKK